MNYTILDMMNGTMIATTKDEQTAKRITKELNELNSKKDRYTLVSERGQIHVD